jgi:hypothetical protein
MADLPFPELQRDELSAQNSPQAKQKQAGGGLFSSKQKAGAIDSGQQMAAIVNITNDISRRLRVIEEKFNNLDRKVKLNEENGVLNFKKATASIASFQDDVIDFRKHIKLDEERTELIIRELKMSAKKEDLAVLQRYIEFWDPVKFATHTEIEKVIQEKIDEIVQKQ